MKLKSKAAWLKFKRVFVGNAHISGYLIKCELKTGSRIYTCDIVGGKEFSTLNNCIRAIDQKLNEPVFCINEGNAKYLPLRQFYSKDDANFSDITTEGWRRCNYALYKAALDADVHPVPPPTQHPAPDAPPGAA